MTSYNYNITVTTNDNITINFHVSDYYYYSIKFPGREKNAKDFLDSTKFIKRGLNDKLHELLLRISALNSY